MDQQRHEDVFQRRQLRQQVIELKDHAELFVPQAVAVRRREIVDAMAEEADFAGGGGVERAEQCKSVLLPEPLWPTIARNSPVHSSRSTPWSTGISCGPLR